MSKTNILSLFVFASIGVLILSLGARYYRISQLNYIERITTATFQTNKLNIGKVYMEHEAKAKLFIWNSGSELLIIENVEVSCSCSSSIANQNKIAPGDSTFITVKYNRKKAGYFYTDVVIHGNFVGSPEILSFEGYLVEQ